MPDHTDDGQQPPRRTISRPPLFTPRVTRSDTSERDATATAARRTSRLFTPPRVPRQPSPAAGEPAVPPLPSSPVPEIAPARAPDVPAGLTARPAPEPPVPPPAGVREPHEAPVPAPASPDATTSDDRRAPLVVGDIETADIALTASAGPGLIDRAEASLPDADAASRTARTEPATPEPRDTIGGVEIDRPVWTFLPESAGSLSAVELPALPAELDDAADSAALDAIERSADAGPWGSALDQSGTSEVADRVEFEQAWLMAATGWEPDEPLESGAPEASVAESEAVTQEMDSVRAAPLGEEPGPAPDVAARREEPAPADAPTTPVVAGETAQTAAAEAPAQEPSAASAAPATSAPRAAPTAPVASAEEEVEEAWAEATRPDAADGGALPDDDALGAPMVEGPRQRYFAAAPEPAGTDAEATAREVDEMTAALGWPDTSAGGLADVAAALPALDAELRASAALFASVPGSAPAADVAAALERIARRIRDGQVVIPRDAAAASEESALAVTLAALLKGPPRG